ncbi:hypothetical protein LC724_11060 [Blautia sp. RD014234]|nr:hypothetical protein [Blautia parvula]
MWGAGDQGTVALDCALAMKRYSRIDFLDIKEKGHRQIPGHTIYEEAKEKVSELIHGYDEVIVASGSNYLREKKIAQVLAAGVPLATLIHPTAVISPLPMWPMAAPYWQVPSSISMPMWESAAL